VNKMLSEVSDHLPTKSQEFIKYMIAYNLLFNYQFEDGIEKVLTGMNHRTKGKSKMNLAIEDLKELNKEFEEDFILFFEDLRNFSNQKIKEIKKTL
jgi:acyl carrier protein phosphodiesterase